MDRSTAEQVAAHIPGNGPESEWATAKVSADDVPAALQYLETAVSAISARQWARGGSMFTYEQYDLLTFPVNMLNGN